MYNYAILANPGHNRIYFDTALQIACSELEAITSAVNIEIQEIGEKDVGLPACLCFSTTTPLTKAALKTIATSSIYYALFEIVDDGLLKPVAVPDFNAFPESMVQILKYTGKTNEQFTRLMVNLALSACNTASENKTLLDPMCGKGTTLYEGMIRGLDVVGVEINHKWVMEIQAFIINFLKKGRFKHKKLKEKRSKGGKKVADGFSLETAADKDDFNAGNVQSFKVFSCDTRETGYVVKKNSCDILVSDLPYGVQHGSKTAKETKLNRSPLELLQEVAPIWHQALKINGAMVISFNEFTMKWQETAELLAQAGFTVQDEDPYVNYLHRVDQSINRNLIVAIKK